MIISGSPTPIVAKMMWNDSVSNVSIRLANTGSSNSNSYFPPFARSIKYRLNYRKHCISYCNVKKHLLSAQLMSKSKILHDSYVKVISTINSYHRVSKFKRKNRSLEEENDLTIEVKSVFRPSVLRFRMFFQYM